MKNRLNKYNINRRRFRHGHKYTKYKMCLIIMMVISIKQHLSNIWISIHEIFNNTEAQLKKSVAYKKKACYRLSKMLRKNLNRISNSNYQKLNKKSISI